MDINEGGESEIRTGPSIHEIRRQEAHDSVLHADAYAQGQYDAEKNAHWKMVALMSLIIIVGIIVALFVS